MKARSRGAALVFLGLWIWLCAHAAGQYYAGFYLQLGSLIAVEPTHAVLLLHFVVLGTAGALCVALGLSLARVPAPGLLTKVQRSWLVVAATAMGLLLPTLVRALVLGESDVTDDESTYRFTAELVSSGRLSVPSPDLKVFFDRAFMTNDGAYFSVYFIGWPVLLAPFEAVGMGGYAASYYFAAGVPVIYLLAREIAGQRWALAALPLYLLSPLAMVGAATRLSHTAALTTLAVTYLVWLRIRRNPAAPWWQHTLLALVFCTAFFVRPYTALAMGLPMLVGWVRLCMRQRALHGLLGALAVALPMAAAFLFVNHLQTGSALLPAYQRTVQYYAENAYFFANRELNAEASAINNMTPTLHAALGQTAEALVRLWPTSLGWPLPALFLPFAMQRSARVAWWMLGCFIFMHLPLHDPGFDSFGPVHYTEAVLPLALLTAAGMRGAHAVVRRLHRVSGDRRRRASAAVWNASLAMAVAGLLLYWPPRMTALAQLSEATGYPLRVASSLPQPALVFAPRPFAIRCRPGKLPTPSHFRFWWPVNSPDFDGPLVWANHISTEQDRRLWRSSFPDRKAFIMLYDEMCVARFVPLAHPAADTIPNGVVRNVRSERGTHQERYDPSMHAKAMGLADD